MSAGNYVIRAVSFALCFFIAMKTAQRVAQSDESWAVSNYKVNVWCGVAMFILFLKPIQDIKATVILGVGLFAAFWFTRWFDRVRAKLLGRDRN
jgi:hypothetical protein